MKLIITGGHLTPALAFAKKALEHKDSLLYVGRDSTSDTSMRQSPEASQVIPLGINYKSIKSIKYNRYKKLESLLKAPFFAVSLYKAHQLIRAEKPDSVVSFGSYVSVPIVLVAKLMGIPVVIHEQTTTLSLATRLTAPLATTIALSYKDQATLLPAHKVVVTGNLIRPEFYQSPPPPAWEKSLSGKPILYVTGGNQGSHFLNTLVDDLTPYLTEKYQLVHQTGNASTLKNICTHGLLRQSWFEPEEVNWLMENGHIVMGRSGANTVAEIMVKGIPSLCIPLPKSQGNEQGKNAALLASVGAGLVIEQKDATKASIKAALTKLETNYAAIKQATRKVSHYHPQNAAESVYQLVYQAVHSQ